jgi:hypothetical protein
MNAEASMTHSDGIVGSGPTNESSPGVRKLFKLLVDRAFNG